MPSEHYESVFITQLIIVLKFYQLEERNFKLMLSANVTSFRLAESLNNENDNRIKDTN
jgi:hypothetical protein